MKKVIAGIALLISSMVQAQEFPQRAPIEITCLFPAGSSADVTARMLAEGMSRHLGQRVLVVNRPGAGGAIGYKYVASQKPDGYSLV
jgi:tripartite-type tricarboxylate transporter receptor subunit TctC